MKASGICYRACYRPIHPSGGPRWNKFGNRIGCNVLTHELHHFFKQGLQQTKQKEEYGSRKMKDRSIPFYNIGPEEAMRIKEKVCDIMIELYI
mmetsp:Transcript_14716/g.21711  ORF Transcript_14716/g.21711 Transcript_14716/m.21711 type:complete len:93 (-) Transcript_14716:15-293(-)